MFRANRLPCGVRAGVCLALLAQPAGADIPLRAKRVASGLSFALGLGQPPGDDGRLFAIEKGGDDGIAHIKIVDLATNTVNPTPFLTLSNVYTLVESGLLGIAFDPEYQSNGHFYLNLTVPGGQFNVSQTQIRRYTRSATNPNLADPASMQVLMRFDQPQFNHNGGWLGFGPNDGYLYIASGDGGGSNDQAGGHTAGIGNAQDTSKLLGKMLRIDVRGDDFPSDPLKNYAIPRGGPGKPPKNPFAPAAGSAENPSGADEIWAYGLRNPWRNSFDRKTGDLWIADVGQGQWEEVDFQPASSTGGENYGWVAKEGTRVTNVTPVPPGVVDPIHEYNAPGDYAITGGYVYRGSENPALEGTYIFADSSSGQIWSLRYDAATKTVSKHRHLTGQIVPDAGSLGPIYSFGEDNLGRIYMIDGDEIFRLVPALPGDANGDRDVDYNDFITLYNNFGNATNKLWSQGDFNDDGRVNFLDFQILERAFGSNVPFGALPEGSPVPEPAGALAVIGALLLARRAGRR
jgi:glucose/arabinose dehydrogenase